MRLLEPLAGQHKFNKGMTLPHTMNDPTQQSLQELIQERDRLRRENAQLAASLLVVKKYADSWHGFPSDVAIVLEQHATALRDLLAPLADRLAHARGGADFGSWRDIRDVELSLRALVKENNEANA